jgi:hypothetical protein
MWLVTLLQTVCGLDFLIYEMRIAVSGDAGLTL